MSATAQFNVLTDRLITEDGPLMFTVSNGNGVQVRGDDAEKMIAPVGPEKTN